jgi:hypothetical protein
MKKLTTLIACGAFISIHAQTILYSENFNGGAPTFTLNTTDQSSTASGYNYWVINNSYTGGSFFEPCYSQNVNIAATAAQPAGITGSPSSKYLHVVCSTASAGGVSNANFLSSDGGIVGCVNDENYFAKMTSDVVTTGQTGVTFSFYWMCTGSPATYGELYYSTNGGSSWTLQQGGMQGQGSWIQSTQTNAAFDNQATLRFGFRFVNTFTFSAGDPPLCIDEVVISVPAPVSVTTGNITAGSPFCAGENLIVPYTITGTFTGGNSFNAQLSDGSGSFASPVSIGSVVSTSAGNINCMIPANTVTGVGYQIRVVSSSPIVTGTTSGPITINALPNASSGNTGPYCAGQTISLSASGGGASYGWAGPLSYTSSSQNPNISSSTVAMTGAYTVTVTSSAGCTSTSSTSVTVNACSGIEDESLSNVSLYPNPAADVFTLSLPDAMVNSARVSIMNLVGEVVYNFTASQSKTMISTESLALRSGIYLVQIKYKDQSKVIRLVIR